MCPRGKAAHQAKAKENQCKSWGLWRAAASRSAQLRIVAPQDLVATLRCFTWRIAWNAGISDAGFDPVAEETVIAFDQRVRANPGGASVNRAGIGVVAIAMQGTTGRRRLACTGDADLSVRAIHQHQYAFTREA